MFIILSRLKQSINADIKELEDLWQEHPHNDYLFAEMCGLKRALRHILHAESKEMVELDKWANGEMKRRKLHG